MFRKRVKKEFPPGTFIPTPARVIAILQLSLGILSVLWLLSQPFLGDLYKVRSKMAIYEFVMGVPDGSELRQRNADRFKALSQQEQKHLINGYNLWQANLQVSFWQKMESALKNVLYGTTPFEKIWIVLSLVLPILALKKVEGAAQSSWLIPIVVFAYSLDNQWNGMIPKMSRELQLFPTETYLLENYGKGDIDGNPFRQRDLLQSSWENYLTVEWSNEPPASDPVVFAGQVENGEYQFIKARALAIGEEKPSTKPTRQPLALLTIHLLWGIVFAYVITKYTCSTAAMPHTETEHLPHSQGA